MGETVNVEVIKAFYAAFARGDMGAILDMLTDDVDWQIAGPAELIPWAGHRRGRAQVADFFALIAETIEISEFVADEFIAQADNVVVLGHDHAMIKATGYHFDNQWVHVFTVTAGKISRLREWYLIDRLMAAYNSVGPLPKQT